jgi:hypothetical protein
MVRQQTKSAKPAFAFVGKPNLEKLAILVERVNAWVDRRDAQMAKRRTTRKV